jgi:hypothetical protein
LIFDFVKYGSINRQSNIVIFYIMRTKKAQKSHIYIKIKKNKTKKKIKRKLFRRKIVGGNTFQEKFFSYGELDIGMYKGYISNNKRNGKGKMTYEYEGGPNGIYDGDWDNNSREGQGKMIFENSDIYEGAWENDEMVGEGKIVKRNGDVYEGTWIATGDLWYGRWGEGARDIGKLKYKNSFIDYYEGKWKNQFMNGFGKMLYNNGSYYEGNFYQNSKLGQGIMTFDDDSIFEGRWLTDLTVIGTMKFSNGDEYIGNMVKNRYEELIIHGRGVMNYLDGTIIEGIWNGGIFDRGIDGIPIRQNNAMNEVHIFASRIDTEEYFDIINEHKDYSDNDLKTYIKTKFTNFINEKFDDDLKNGEEQHFDLDSKTKLFANLDLILVKLFTSTYSEESKIKNIVGRSIDFVMKQNKKFIDLYIKSFIHDCVKAYIAPGDEAFSCVSGIVERFYMTVGSTVENICLETDCKNNDKYTKILRMFFIPDFNDFIRQWVQESSNENEEWSDELKGTGDDIFIKRRENFVTFMRNKYEDLGLLNTFNINKINKEADDYANNEFFKKDLLQLGGKKKKNSYRKSVNKKLKKLNIYGK